MKKIDFKLTYTPPFALYYHTQEGAAVRSFWIDGRPIAMKLVQKKPNGPVYATAYPISISVHSPTTSRRLHAI